MDFSPVAVAKASAVAAAAGLSDRARFVTADVSCLPVDLHRTFDVCHVSRGVFSWVADLAGWMHQAASTLRPGGVLAVTDIHPLYLMCGGVDPLLLDFPYADHGPLRQDDQTGSYVAGVDETSTTPPSSTAAPSASCSPPRSPPDWSSKRFEEHLAVETHAHRDLAVRGADGLLRWQVTGQDLPVMFSLRARRP